MTTTTFGSAAGSIRVTIALPADLRPPDACTDQADHPAGCDCPIDVDSELTVEEPTLVLEDGGNCLAYFIDGDVVSWRALAVRILIAVDAFGTGR